MKNIYNDNFQLLEKLAEEFGNDIIRAGELDRSKLGEIVFADSDKLKRLNSIVHPVVEKRCEELSKIPCVLDAPQLFEAKLQSKCYKIICVTADENIRLDRIMRRDGISLDKARERINSQLSEKYYIENSDYVVYNNGENIKTQIDNILEEIL